MQLMVLVTRFLMINGLERLADQGIELVPIDGFVPRVPEKRVLERDVESDQMGLGKGMPLEIVLSDGHGDRTGFVYENQDPVFAGITATQHAQSKEDEKWESPQREHT